MAIKFFSYNLLTVCTVCLLATSVDIPLSWPSPMITKLILNDTSKNQIGRPITPDETTWIGSLVPMAAAVGAFPFGYISDKFGRKVGLLCTALPLIISFFTLAFGKQIELIYFARVIAGLSMGAGYALLPIYLGEVSRDCQRGMMSQALNVFWALGNFISYSTGPFLSYKLFNLLMGCIPAAFFMLFSLIAPESPYFLVSQNKMKEATKSLMLLRTIDEEEAQTETETIIQLLKKEENGRITDLFTNSTVRRAFAICMSLVMAQELCGFTVILIYLQPIFDATDTKISSDYSSLIIAVIGLLSTFINPFFIDKSGRRILIIVSFLGMFVSLAGLGAFFFIKDSTDLSTDSVFWLPIVTMISYLCFFNVGMSAVPWTLISEMFPSNVKQAASTTISSASWALSFFITKYFSNVSDGIGMAQSFWTFAVINLLSAIFSMLLVPETKGMSFGEIQDMLESGRVLQWGKRRRNLDVCEVK